MNTHTDFFAKLMEGQPPPEAKGRRILVVDDQWAAIQAVGPILGRMGHEVIPALDGATALRRAAATKPDLVLLDLFLPDMDGCEVCRRLHATPEGKDIPVIFVSSADQQDFIVPALAAGGLDYITKPYNEHELASRIRTALALKATRDELALYAENKDHRLGMLAHDLKGALSGVIMSAELLGEGAFCLDDEAGAGLVSGILEPSRRRLAFVKDFLAKAASAHARHIGESGGGQPAKRAARILVVDDHAANIQTVGSVLGKLGHEIIPAKDGPTALKRLAAMPPDLILLDLLMPTMDGVETCRRIHQTEAGRDVPVIFLSAADDKDSGVRSLKSGAVDFVTKPFHTAELVQRVGTQLALKFNCDRLADFGRERNKVLAQLAADCKAQFGRMHADALELCRRLGGSSDGRSIQLAENILRSCAQLLGFVKWISAKEHSIFVLVPRCLDLSKIAACTIQRHKESARQKGLSLLMDGDEPSAFAHADEIALNQVLDNLVSNAIKFSSPEKTIRLSVRTESSAVECLIADQGPGFTEEDKARMFQRFGRLSACPTAGEVSTGLGLSIAHELAQAMNGEVTCQSTAGSGTTFTVRLPRATSASN